MKIVLMHRKMDHWTEYSPLADSCAGIPRTSYLQYTAEFTVILCMDE